MRRLTNLAAATSLLLCLACVCMWLRSGCVFDAVCKGRSLTIGSSRGLLWMEVLSSRAFLHASVRSPWEWRVRWYRGWPGWQFPHPRYEHSSAYSDFMIVGQPRIPDGTKTSVWLPYWLLTLLTGILPALWFWQRRKERRAMRGRAFEVVVEKPADPDHG